MQYTVALQDVCENDQLVLRLIFSLSAKARGRTHAYCLIEHGSDSGADICIRNPADDMSPADDNSSNTIWLDAKANHTTGINYNISKPLIASRVLSILDRYIEERQTVAPPAHVEASVNEEVAPADEMDFCISEEEASQLAIVDDESLSNPANLTPLLDTADTAQAPEPAAKPDKIASLLVLHKNRELEVSQQAFESRAQHAATNKPRALVVDDSPSVRKQIELELDLFNVDVDYAESVSDALAQLEQNHYDVAFLDVVLPDGDGFRICRNIKQNSKTTKVIMLTGKATPADKVKGTMAGCDAYLVKPVGRMTFQNTACNYLQLREQLEVIHA